MATAPLTYVAGPDPETLKANQAYQDALTRLTESLEGRKNRMFDPQLLALAEGLLTPGRTGSFFEGLGTAAGKMRQAEELEEKRAQEIAQAQLGLAEKGLTLAQRRQLADYYSKRMGQIQGPQEPAKPAEQTPSTNVVVSDVYGTGYRIGPPRPDPAINLLFSAAQSGKDPFDVEKALAEETRQRFKTTEAGTWDLINNVFFPTPSAKQSEVVYQGDTYPVPEGLALQASVFRQTGRAREADNLIRSYLESTKAKTTTQAAQQRAAAEARGRESEQLQQVPITYNGEEYKVPPAVAQRFNAAPNSAEAGKVLSEHFRATVSPPPQTVPSTIAPPGAAPALPAAAPSAVPAEAPGAVPSAAPSAAPSAPSSAVTAPAEAPSRPPAAQPAIGVLSERQRKELAEASMMDVKARTEWNNKQREEIFAREKEAEVDERIVRQFKALANKPWAKDIYGITSNDNLMSAAINLGESGLGVRTSGGGGFTIGIPNLNQVLINLSVPREAQPDVRTFLQLVAESQMRRTALIKGAASDFDQRISGEAGVNIKDTPEAIIRKAELRMVRGNFDKEVAAYIRRTGVTPYDLPDTSWYKNRLLKLDNDLLALQQGGQVVPASQVPRPAGVGSNWTLKEDSKGNKAWVSPDNKEFVEVK